MAVETRISLRNLGVVDPESLDDYLGQGGYQGFLKVLGMDPRQVIAEVEKSGLRGRGGAGFPTGLKWKYTSQYSGDTKYVVCNADEGEPGTFKDRVLMEGDPHTYLEGLMIAAYSIQAATGFIYIRGEYVKSIKRTRLALTQLKEHGFLGENIKGSGYSLDLKLRIGAGSYLCGEEVTLLESLEGKRGTPRYKPPFPAEVGLLGKPTIVNNVETLSQVTSIISRGADWYRQYGTEKSPGTKLFSLSGDVKKPGCYEVELGTPLRRLIYDYGAGITGDHKLKSVLIGGAAGTFLAEESLDVPMDYDEPKKIGGVIGSGAIMVLDQRRSLAQVLAHILNFFKHGSCGKCVPCRVGTKQLMLFITEFQAPGITVAEKEKLLVKMVELSELMAKNSLCALGQSPILPLKSALQNQKADFLKD